VSPPQTLEDKTLSFSPTSKLKRLKNRRKVSFSVVNPEMPKKPMRPWHLEAEEGEGSKTKKKTDKEKKKKLKNGSVQTTTKKHERKPRFSIIRRPNMEEVMLKVMQDRNAQSLRLQQVELFQAIIAYSCLLQAIR